MELLRLVTAGSVDDGKSTLIGRLLHDTKSIPDDQLATLERDSRRRGGEGVDLALLTDGLRAEREQGITIDVAYRYFSTSKRAFILADCPGHVQYTRNMVTGASTANAALILVDARKGVLEQTRRHLSIASLLRVPHLVLCVNKMDLVDYDRATYTAIHDAVRDFAARLDIADLTSIPIAALHGDNVVTRSMAMPWYEGPPLLHHVEHLHIASDRNLIDVRFPVQYVIRAPGTDHSRAYAGQVASGVLRPGDDVAILPTGLTTTITSIDTADGPIEAAYPTMSIALALADDLDVARGDLICRHHNRPHLTRELDALVCWMSPDRTCTAGSGVLVKHTTRTTRAEISALHYRLDINTLHRDRRAGCLDLNDLGRVRIHTAEPLLVDEYRRNRTTGSFLLIDDITGDTLGAAMISAVADAPIATSTVVWHESRVDRAERPSTGVTVLITGLSASGKSTLAVEVERRLIDAGQPCYILDGDNLRHGLNSDLGFDRPSRQENVRRVGSVAQLFADAGLIALVPVIAPYAAGRHAVRTAHRAAGIPFIEVHLATPLDECERRDPKGLYRQARAGQLTGMTGLDDPYEPPTTPELRLDGTEPVATAADRVLAAIAAVRQT